VTSRNRLSGAGESSSRGIVQPDQRAEPPGGNGQHLQRLPVGRRVVGFQGEGCTAGQGGGFGQRHPHGDAEVHGFPGADPHPLPTAIRLGKNNRFSIKLRPRGADPLDGPAGEPDRE
jgi:hypothetical protein